jgi:hypothetical protein
MIQSDARACQRTIGGSKFSLTRPRPLSKIPGKEDPVRRFSTSVRPILFVTAVLILALTASVPLSAGQPQGPGRGPRHIASPEAIHEAARALPDRRAADIEKIDRVLASPALRDEIARWGVSAGRVREGLSRLDDTDLSSLASRADGYSTALQGGESAKTHHTILMIMLAVLGAMFVSLLFI